MEGIELTLEDRFQVLGTEKSQPAQLMVNSIEPSANISLPAALCDEELIAELNAIPDKMGFKIGEVADLLNIKQYVLRYWETEFDILKPKKAQNNQRYYTRKDVENAFLIRKLLHRDRFSIEGARSAMRDLKQFVKKEKNWSQINSKVVQMQDRIDDLLIDLRRFRGLFL
jgi:DNA-binding transcriptional MerR regulator